MFWKKKNRPGPPNPVVPKVITEPDPKEIPPTRLWRIEQTDGHRTVEAHEYEKGDHYVTFYRWTGSYWEMRNWLTRSSEGVVHWRHHWSREVVCELNHDYILAIEESI